MQGFVVAENVAFRETGAFEATEHFDVVAAGLGGSPLHALREKSKLDFFG